MKMHPSILVTYWRRRLWRSLRSQEMCLFKEPMTYLVTTGDCAFAKPGPKLWNDLSSDITSDASLDVLKTRLHLFSQAYKPKLTVF